MSELTERMHEKRPTSPNELVPIGPDDPARFLNRDLQWLEDRKSTRLNSSHT